MYTCVNTKSIEENLQWKKSKDLKSMERQSHNSDPVFKESISKESYDHYPFTVYPLPSSEMGKPIDPLNTDFHMSRFSFGNPHYIYAGNLFKFLILSLNRYLS